jgi:hypothetical protein
VSLGNAAYFMRFAEPPEAIPDPLKATSICLFSPKNHPPPRDFIKHLPYSADDSKRLDNTVLAYSLVTPPNPAPILFGYAFEKAPRKDKSGDAYQHPHSFYFSGYPGTPPNAPIVSQNYKGFSTTRPAEELWTKVIERRDKEKSPLPFCNLFAGEGAHGSSARKSRGHSWGQLQQ